MRKIDIHELRTIQLSLLDEVDVFCKKNGIRYSLCGGTLLGAVRHGGYIPWDDDIDLMMPREDYDRFARTFRSPRAVLQDLRENPAVIESFLKVCRRGTLMLDTTLGRRQWGIYIDIFPIDGAPADYAEHCRRLAALRAQLPVVCPFYRIVPHHKGLWLLKYLVKRALHPSYANILDLKDEIEDLARTYSPETSGFAGVLLGCYGEREVMLKYVFADYGELMFEGKAYPAIMGYDAYLKSLYGNYMQLPPEEERTSHHHYEAYVED